MPTKSKSFRVATEGATTDGRNIERAWLVQAAKNYKRSTYAARVNLEHLRSIHPDSTFRCYGDVVGLESREEDGKMRLYAHIEPLPELLALNKAKQKLFTSIEIDPNFADTGEAYLVGLAVTDNPASLGTEMLSFAAQNPKASPFAARKANPNTLFSEAVEVELQFEDDPTEDAKKFSERLRELVGRFTSKGKTDDARFGELVGALEELGEHMSSQAEVFATDRKAREQLDKTVTELKQQFAGMKAIVDKIDTTPAPGFIKRPTATGARALAQTDC